MEGDIRKKGNWRKSRWLFLLFLATGYWLLATDVHAGQATAHNYFYKLALGDKGQPQVDLVNAALDRADAELAILAAGGSLSATAPLTYNSSTGVIALPQAGASASGYLASADWSAFNAKQAALPSGTSSQYLRGDLTMQTLNQAAVAGLTSASAPNFAGIKIGAYSIDTAVAAVTAATTGGGDPVVSFYNAGGTRIAFIDNLGAYNGLVSSSGDPATQSGSCFIGMGMYRQNPALGMSFMFGESLATGKAGFTIAPILGTISTSNNIFRICLDAAFTEPVMVVDGNGALHLGKYGAGFLVSDASGNITATTTPALGTPASGTLTNCTFPTLNQNTTGTAAGLSGTQTQNYIYGGPASGGNGSALFRAMVALDIPGMGAAATTLTPSGTVAISASTTNLQQVCTLTPGQTESITISGGQYGQSLYLLILTSGSSTYTLTFSTGFHPASTLATGSTSGKYFMLHFVNVGGTYFEVSRTAAM